MADLDWRVPTLPSSDHVEMELTAAPCGHNEPAALAGRIRLVVAPTAERDQLIQSKSEPPCERFTAWWTSRRRRAPQARSASRRANTCARMAFHSAKLGAGWPLARGPLGQALTQEPSAFHAA